jgi:hypothetical protein
MGDFCPKRFVDLALLRSYGQPVSAAFSPDFADSDVGT